MRLRRLAAAHPLPLPAPDETQLLRYFVAAVRQYRRPSVAWATMLAAGYAGALQCLQHGPELERWLAWWVRQRFIQVEQANQYSSHILPHILTQNPLKTP